MLTYIEICKNPVETYQAFCGMEYFQWKFSCNLTGLVHFRKRIGEQGAEKILQASAGLHGKDALEDYVTLSKVLGSCPPIM